VQSESKKALRINGGQRQPEQTTQKKGAYDKNDGHLEGRVEDYFG
jgi:hypothetical protein